MDYLYLKEMFDVVDRMCEFDIQLNLFGNLSFKHLIIKAGGLELLDDLQNSSDPKVANRSYELL